MPKVRLELVADFGPKRGQTFAGIVVEPDYGHILQAGLNKLKPKPKGELILVLRDKYQGTKVLSREANLKEVLRDGATIVFTHQRPTLKFPKPPRAPLVSCTPLEANEADVALDLVDEGQDESNVTIGKLYSGQCEEEIDSADGRPPEHCDDDWHGCWPVFQGSILSLVRRAIAKTPGFVEKSMGAYIVFDYHTSSCAEWAAMFPDPNGFPRKSEARLIAAVRRECRGLLVDSITGEILARRLPKFFNVDEVEEARMVSLPVGGVATEKLDGSLVSPFVLDGAVRWAGKAALVPAVEDFVASRPGLRQVAELVRRGHTPIFEWCEAGPPVGVIGHKVSRLVLIAVRNMVTGEFWPHDKLQNCNCEVVSQYPFEGLPDFLQLIRSLTDLEGYVVSWPKLGRMVKIKSAWWIELAAAQQRGKGQPALALHGALAKLSFGSIPAELFWQAILTADDDQMSLIYGCLTTSNQVVLRKFVAAVQQGITILDQEMCEWAECVREASESDLSRIAGGWPLPLLTAYQRRSPVAEKEIRNFLTKLALRSNLLVVESIVGTTWDSTHQAVEACGHLGTFDKAPDDLKIHVLSKYLPKKLGDYMGCAIAEETTVRVEPLYEASEGKIKGMWEQFLIAGIVDLRVDLQPRAKAFDSHNGDKDFAHWLVQYGPNDTCPRSTKAKDGDRKGAFAGVLMRTGTDVEFSHLRDAMEQSFDMQCVIKLDPIPTKVSHVYLDLDGVLVDFNAGFDADCLDAKAKWQHIEKTVGFYEFLPWIEAARQLWKHFKEAGLPVTILTGVPEGSLGERSAAEKKAWVARELGPTVEVITCLTRDKSNYGGPGRLLIDDRPQKGWEVVGGRQILHRSVPETMLTLVDLGLGRVFAAPREKICIVESVTEDLRIALEHAEMVGIDTEWPPDCTGAPQNSATVLQLAFYPSAKWLVFIVDLLTWDVELQGFIRDLLNSELPKCLFGSGDAERLGMHISSAKDLREDSLSLAVQARKAGLILNKTKLVQASDWSVRPLRDEQIIYAATDALVLLELSGGQAVKKQPMPIPSVGRNAVVEYSGIFISADARAKLLRRFPPMYAQVVADHLTLAWQPDSVKGLAVGVSLKLRVEALGSDENIQAVSVSTLDADPRSGHITISHRQDVAAVEANHLTFNSVDSFVLDGVIGVCVSFATVRKDTLPEQILTRLDTLADSLPGQSETFEHLTGSQRYAIHQIADELGLEHRSEGKKGSSERKLIVSVPRKFKKKVVNPESEKTIIKDPRKFAALFGDVPGLHLHGRITRNGIAWEPGVKVPPRLQNARGYSKSSGTAKSACAEHLVIILRGFPGSGKSSLAAHLRRLTGAEVISADKAWEGIENIRDAHNQCREDFAHALRESVDVILDNTNVRMGDYAFYRTKAEACGYRVVILEIVCESTAQLELYRKRSIHDVPGSKVGGMWTRWEHDPTALRLLSYSRQELMPWLNAQSLLNRQPYTHLVMPKGPFFSVPATHQDEFLELFTAEWGQHYISEQAPAHAFQLFFDIDKLTWDVLLSALPPLHDLIGKPLVVTGTDESPPGYHIFVPGSVVDVSQALTLCQQWVDRLPWLEKHIDSQIYQGGKQSFLGAGRSPALRLLGSRKISKEGVDMGRLHSVLGRFDGAWQNEFEWKWSDVSIRVLQQP